MGNLLKVLTREIENYPHFFLDFESKFYDGITGQWLKPFSFSILILDELEECGDFFAQEKAVCLHVALILTHLAPLFLSLFLVSVFQEPNGKPFKSSYMHRA